MTIINNTKADEKYLEEIKRVVFELIKKLEAKKAF